MRNKLKFSVMKGKSFIAVSLAVLLLVVLPVLGFYMSSGSITDYYYYQNKQFHLNIRTDKIFVKTKTVQTKESLSVILSSYSQVAYIDKIDANQQMQFVNLNTQNTAKSINDLVKALNQNPEIEFSSPVYSPFDGGGNKVLQGLIDEILVQFKPGISENIINDYLKINELSIVQSLSLTGGTSYVLKVSKNKELLSIDAANMVFNSGLVNWAEPNFYYSGLLQSTPNDVFFPRQWSVKNTGNNIPEGIVGTAGCDMRVDSAWNLTTGVSACIVGMVDSGIDTTHEDIKANLINSKGYDFINGHPLQTDDMNHGTCTGGIVGAVQNNTIGISGIAPNVKLIGIKIFNSAGSTTTTALTNGLIYSWQQGEWISSNSWGGGSPVSAADQAILDGVTLGRGGKGTIFCVATGNGNTSLQWPSTNANVIAVGGNTPCNTRKSTSSCDGETWWGANYGTGLSIVAPCVKVYATDRMGGSGYTGTNYDSTFNGTSSATPNCAGVVALSLSYDSTQRWDSVRVRLCRTADKIGTYSYTSAGPFTILGSTWNNEMGYGKINAYKLLKLNQQLLGPVISHTPLANTEQTTGTRTVNCVITPANSGINPSTVKLYYAKNSTTWSNVTMTNAGGTNWTVNLTLSGAGTYNYYLTATDSSSRTGTAPLGAPTSYYTFIASSDTIKPIITHTALGNQPKQNWPVTVTATVTDNIGVDSAWVRWYKNTTSNYKRFKLTNTSGSTYASLFNSVSSDVVPGDTIYYRIIAQDISSGHNRDSTALYKFAITNVVSNNICRTVWVPIRDNATNYDSFQVGTHSTIIKVNFTMGQLIHTYDGDVTFAIRAPNGTEVILSANNGSSGDNYISTVFNDSATTPIASGTAPFTGTFNPGSPLSAFSGLDPYGWWRLRVSDNAGGDTGHVGQYCVQIFSGGILVGTSTIGNIIPTKYSLNQNYPNPFNPVTKISFDVPKQGLVSLKIYDVLGREVRTLVNEIKAPGVYAVDFNGTELSSGVYFYRMEANGYTDIKKMMLIK
jgi:subtilisin family serine protease/subtilisin-like proprotein convertase family protein